MPTEPLTKRFLDVARLFFKLGLISFGGPAASTALFEQEVVNKRGWLSREHFLDLLATASLVPGANMVEMAVHIGFLRAGYPGFLAGGIAFILPAFIISWILGVLYVRWGVLPQVQTLFYGINPIILAVILTASYRLGKGAMRDWRLLQVGIASFAAALLGVEEVVIMLGAGAAGMLLTIPLNWMPVGMFFFAGTPALLSHASTMLAAIQDRLILLVLFFLKVGVLLFGSGMVLFAFIQRDVVDGYAWLTQGQLLDAIAIGQMTPGPVLSSATFIGYLVAGTPGAVLATIAVFLPSFVIIAILNPWIPRLRQNPWVRAFLNGINAAVVALILAVSLSLFRSAVTDLWSGAIFLVALVALLRFRLDALWLVAGGGLLGLVHYFLT